MPIIVGDVGSVAHQTWITTGYMLASTIVMLIYGDSATCSGGAISA
ncbi:hypothetical protein [Corynebacterium halotolerans]